MVKSRSVDRAAQQRVAHRAADQREVVPGGREPLAEVGQQRQVGRQVGDRPAQQGGRRLTGGHDPQLYAACDPAVSGPGCVGTGRRPAHWLQ